MAQADPRVASRNLITQEAFSVAPHLIGLPLARPSRRLTAVLLDLLIVTILVQAGGGFLLAVAAAFAFFRLAARGTWGTGRLFGRAVKLAFRGVGALILFIVFLSLWNRGDDDDDDEGDPDPRPAPAAPAPGTAAVPDSARPVTALGAVRMIRGTIEFQNAESEEEAVAAARSAVAEMRKTGESDAKIRAGLIEIARESDADHLLAAIDQVLPADSAALRRNDPDSLATAYARALAANDSAALDSLRPKLGGVLAADRIGELRGEVGGLRQELRSKQEELERERKRGFLSGVLDWLDDLGLGFGWTGLYFTAFTALWKGQTPGKRLLGIRVVRLNGLPMTLWGSFERFGGYAAGLFTGLLGFAQVYWDRNRQAIHDKITETVVVRERQPLPEARPAPGSPGARAGYPSVPRPYASPTGTRPGPGPGSPGGLPPSFPGDGARG